jgi:hypothetical protein
VVCEFLSPLPVLQDLGRPLLCKNRIFGANIQEQATRGSSPRKRESKKIYNFASMARSEEELTTANFLADEI